MSLYFGKLIFAKNKWQKMKVLCHSLVKQRFLYYFLKCVCMWVCVDVSIIWNALANLLSICFQSLNPPPIRSYSEYMHYVRVYHPFVFLIPPPPLPPLNEWHVSCVPPPPYYMLLAWSNVPINTKEKNIYTYLH